MENEVKNISEDDLREYAQNIIVAHSDFKDFVVALMDFLGRADLIVIQIYKEIRRERIPIDIKFTSEELVGYTGFDELNAWYAEFCYKKKCDEEKLRREVKENIDELHLLIRDYRKTENFKIMLSCVCKFPYLAPYNAMLVGLQKPGARFVLGTRKWEERYKRQPKVNAQKLVALIPFGPVQVLFDYADTEPIPNTNAPMDLFEGDVSSLLDEWNNSLLDAQGNILKWVWNCFEGNLKRYGIYLDTDFNAANTYGGYLWKNAYATIVTDEGLKIIAPFILSVNRQENEAAKFHTICHELGHLFCRHLFYSSDKQRVLTTKEEEFEAETVAYLVCKRCGIKDASEKYLATYATDGDIPLCSLDYILKAVTEIEKMLKEKVSLKETAYYKNDKQFRKIVDEWSRMKKEQKRRSDSMLSNYTFDGF